MMKKSKFLASVCLIAGMGFMFSCQEDEDLVKDAQPQELDNEMVELITQKGYDAKDIYIKDGYYRVKGHDFAFDPETAKNLAKQSDVEEEQRWSGATLYYSYTRDVRIYIDSSFPSYYNGPLYYAARHWSNVSPNINVYITSSRSYADIVVSGYYDPNEYGWAVGGLPTGNGNVGSYIWINTYQPHNQSYGDKVALMVHELGHNLGYHHTDQGYGYHIPGTASYDRYSVMNSSVPGGQWQYNSAGWTYNDRVAIHWAYGLY